MLTRRRFTALALVGLSAAAILALAPEAGAQGADAAPGHSRYRIRYDSIADTREGRFVGFTTPAINDRGTVAFLGYPSGDGAGAGIFTTKNGRHFKTIVTSDHPTLVAFGPPSINNRGLVAFEAVHRWDGSSDSGVYAGYGPDSLAAVATTEGDSPFINFGMRVSVNDGGKVAFHAYRQIAGAISTGVFLGGPSGTVHPVATTTTHPEFASFSDAPHLNNAGVVAFRGVRTFAEGSTQALLAGRVLWNGAPQLSVLFDNRAPTILGGFGDSPYLTDGGTLAFGGVIKGRPAGLGVFTSPLDGTFETHATTRDEPFGVLRDPAVNDRGLVVFPAIRTAAAGGGSALYARIPGVDAPVCIAERGQQFLGGEVESVSFFRGLNEKNQIAFQYRLTNDAEGIAVARVHLPDDRDY
ncbi:MAG TPA: choice-of-anchor tandem repeat NxxGxxAF-containing protein [Armatimonadaceae bacterium]|nr:choice-of-anchor tandem repeat NxxGxxAF-containing protein [Armatimonadaceae bacterium]